MSEYIPLDALRPSQQAPISRRTLLQSGAKTAVGVAAVVCGADLRPIEATQPGAEGKSPMLSPTPACDDAAPTLSQAAGPFYTPNPPERTSLLEPGVRGTRLVVSGRVWNTDCQPLAGALLDFWQADDDGVYEA